MCFFLILFSHISAFAQCATPFQDDGIYCTDDVFNNSTGMWDHIPNHPACSDGNPSNGVEICLCALGCIQGPLPINLIEFKGAVLSGEVQLEWTTADELNNMGFEVQKSTSGKDWLIIGFVEGLVMKNKINAYQFQDRNLNAGINYYRLKQIDFDGQFEYSKIVFINGTGKNEVSIFPNPSNGIFSILGVENTETEAFTLMNSVGQTVAIKVQNDGQVDMSAHPSGVYYMRVVSSGQVLRLIKA